MKIGICGAGTMGRGIALSCIQSGLSVKLYDMNQDLLASASEFVSKQLEQSVAKNRMTSDEANHCHRLLSICDQVSEFKDRDLVIEAIVENREIKVELFKTLENMVGPDAIISSNTSSISIASLARDLERPERFVGLHFFNPAHIMKLVEIIRSPRTDESVVQSAVQFVKTLGKSAAVAKDVPGFIVNRVARNYYNEAQRIVTESGAEIAQVDAIMKAAGFKMGPFELMDLIGVDVNLDVTKSIYQQYFQEPRFQPSQMQQQYVDAGLHGRKTGRGFYDYQKKV